MNLVSLLWLRMASLFIPVQLLFNGNFWEVFKDKFGSFTGESVLDLACGTGDMRQYIHPKKYLGLDMNSSYIEHAKKRFTSSGSEFEVQDILLYQPENKFDTIFLVGSSHHLSDEQLRVLFKILYKSKVKNFIVADGFPVGIFAPLLSWLDDVLGGGKYFRDTDELKSILKEYFFIKEVGTLYARRSFYKYPYVVCSV